MSDDNLLTVYAFFFDAKQDELPEFYTTNETHCQLLKQYCETSNYIELEVLESDWASLLRNKSAETLTIAKVISEQHPLSGLYCTVGPSFDDGFHNITPVDEPWHSGYAKDNQLEYVEETHGASD